MRSSMLSSAAGSRRAPIADRGPAAGSGARLGGQPQWPQLGERVGDVLRVGCGVTGVGGHQLLGILRRKAETASLPGQGIAGLIAGPRHGRRHHYVHYVHCT